MEEKRILVKTDNMAMRWGEMDSLGHMNNVSYYRYFEEGRISWFDGLNIGYRSVDQGPILGTMTCKYLKPAVYPVEFCLKTYIGELSKRSFTMWGDLYNSRKSDELFATSKAIMVWIDIKSGRSCDLPDRLRDLF